MAEIEFIEQLNATSDFSGISFDDATTLFENVFTHEQLQLISYVTGKGNLVQSFSCNGGLNITLNDVFNLGSLTYADIVDLVPVNSTAKAINATLAKTPDERYELHLIVEITNLGSDSSQVSIDINTEILIVDNEGPNVHYSLDDRTDMIFAGSSIGLVNQLRFGMGTFAMPTRDSDLPLRMLCLFLGHATPDPTSEDFILYAGGSGTITYTVAPGTYYVPIAPDYYYLGACLDLSVFSRWGLDFQFDYIDESPEAGPPSEPGGYNPGGTGFDDSSDTIDLPGVPDIGVSDVGFVNVYKTGVHSLQDMGVELFPPLTYTAPTAITANDTTEAIINGFNSIVTFFANIPSFFDQLMANALINYVIDCHMIPVTPSVASSDEAIKVGYKTLQARGYKVSSDYKDVDCGTISLAEYYTNFADFLTTFKLFLPFVGFVSARPEWFYRESLNVTYRFNVIDGSFMAYVRSIGKYVNNNNSGKTIVAQYGGNACVHLPITGVTYASMVSGLVGAGAGAIAATGSGNLAAAATSAIAAAGAHGDIAQSNAYASSAAFLGCRRPFVMIERPVSDFSKTYSKEMGIPSNVSRKLDSVTGFNVIGDLHLDGITATDAEKAEIERLLHEGVIL